MDRATAAAGAGPGAASWAARDWLGRPCLDEGAPADLVVFDDDPRVNLGVARHPALIVLRHRDNVISRLRSVGRLE